MKKNRRGMMPCQYPKLERADSMFKHLFWIMAHALGILCMIIGFGLLVSILISDPAGPVNVADDYLREYVSCGK